MYCSTMKIQMFNDFIVKRNSGVELKCSKPACDAIQQAFDKNALLLVVYSSNNIVSSHTFSLRFFSFSGVYQVTL